MTTNLVFQETTFHPVTRNGQPWLTSAEIGAALGYADPAKKIHELYTRHSDEFTPAMTFTPKLGVKGFGNGNSAKSVRVFSLRGCHLLAMFSRTPVAKEFRRWVLDILDKEAGNTPAVTLTHSEAANLSALLHILPAYKDVQKKAESVLRAAQSPLAAQVHDAWAEPLLSCLALSDLARRCQSTSVRHLSTR